MKSLEALDIAGSGDGYHATSVSEPWVVEDAILVDAVVGRLKFRRRWSKGKGWRMRWFQGHI